MNLYSCIFFTAGPDFDESTVTAKLVKLSKDHAEYLCPGATHLVDSDAATYWSPGYPHGDWRTLSRLLLSLLSNPGITAVWYDSDACDTPELYTLERARRYVFDFHSRLGYVMAA